MLLVPTVLHGLLAHPVIRAVAVLSALLLVTWSSAGTSCLAESSGDLILRDISGHVEQTLSANMPTGEVWLEAVIDDGSPEPLRVRLAPIEAFERSGFELREGDPIKLRLFVSDDPPAVQRIRNLRTGAVLRLRCIHGEPLWDRHHHRGTGRRASVQ